MGLADEIEGLVELHRDGALTDEEFDRAKERLLAPSAGTAGTQNPNAEDRGTDDRRLIRSPRRRLWVLALVALVVMAALASSLGVALSNDDGEQREDADCQQIADDLAAQGRPMAELYPALRGMGCGEWLDEQFENNGAE